MFDGISSSDNRKLENNWFDWNFRIDALYDSQLLIRILKESSKSIPLFRDFDFRFKSQNPNLLFLKHALNILRLTGHHHMWNDCTHLTHNFENESDRYTRTIFDIFRCYHSCLVAFWSFFCMKLMKYVGISTPGNDDKSELLTKRCLNCELV